MRDQYNVGQAGAVGPGSQAENVHFNQIWAQMDSGVDLAELADQLGQLRKAMWDKATGPEQDVAVGEIAQAEEAARQGNGPNVLKHLKAAGKWALDMATEVGTNLASETLKNAMGM